MGGNSKEHGAAVVPSSARPPPAYQCLHSLKRRGIHTIYGVKYDDDTTTRSRYCDEFVSLGRPSDDVLAYKDRLLEVASRDDVRTVVPTSEYDAYVLSKFREEFESQLSLAVPSFEALHTVHDRVRLFDAAEAAGVPVPETVLLDDVDDWSGDRVVKSRYNLITNDYEAWCPRDEAVMVKDVSYFGAGEVPDVEELTAEMQHTPISQEYIPRRDEYMVGALCRHGEPLAMSQLRQIREDSYVGGGGVYRKSVQIPELETVARRLLAELDWHGLACIEYMEDARTGEFKLTEINPRIWQSIVPSVRSGVDFPYYYWLLASGRPDLIDPRPETGVGSHFIQGEVEHLLSVLRERSEQVPRPNPYVRAGEILLSSVTDPRFDEFRIDDPQPFVYGVLSGLRTRLSSVREERPSSSVLASLLGPR